MKCFCKSNKQNFHYWKFCFHKVQNMLNWSSKRLAKLFHHTVCVCICIYNTYIYSCLYLYMYVCDNSLPSEPSSLTRTPPNTQHPPTAPTPAAPPAPTLPTAVSWLSTAWTWSPRPCPRTLRAPPPHRQSQSEAADRDFQFYLMLLLWRGQSELPAAFIFVGFYLLGSPAPIPSSSSHFFFSSFF